jgi:carboxymethylenebutenolidase
VRVGIAAGGFDGWFVPAERPAGVAVLLLAEMFGVTPAMQGSAAGFAAAGYPALAPNLFWRSRHPGVLAYEGPERQLAWERLQGFDAALAMADIGAAVDWLRARTGGLPVVAVGHCMGGRLAAQAAARLGLAGAASFYGLGLAADAEDFAALRCPVQLHYGLADEHVPASEIAAVRQLVSDNAWVTLHGYPGAGHSFCNPARPMFDAVQAAQVQARTLELLAGVASPAAAGHAP